MKKIDVDQLKQVVAGMAEQIIGNEAYLTRIDTVIGDGDHGFGMKKGFMAVLEMIGREQFETAEQLMRAAGMELVKTMGGASGVIFGTLFIGGLQSLGHSREVTLVQLAGYFRDGEQAIEKRGRAKPGQKTMLDALEPASQALLESANEDAELEEAFKRAYEAALDGVEKCKSMKSRVGRSKNFQQATVGEPDPGAVSTSLLFKAFYESLVCLGEKTASTV